MNLGPHLLAILAVGAVSTNVAVARHHGHRADVGAIGTLSTTNSHGLAKSPISNGAQQGPPPVSDSGVPDHGNAEKNAINPSPHSKTLSRAGITPDNATASGSVHDHNHTVTPGSGIQDGGPGTTIDTSITVHQGRDVIRNRKVLTELIKLKQRLAKKSNPAIATGTDFDHQHALGNHQKITVGSGGGLRRNAIGVLLGHRVSTSTANATPSAPNAAAGNAGHADHVIKPAAGTAPIDNASIPGQESMRHSPGVGTVNVAPANGGNISGTGMGHPWLATGAIGGPAKLAGGFISGNSFRPKHP